jgi:NAD+ synthase
MSLSIALAQVDPTVGDVTGNLALIRRTRDQAGAQGADLVVFPELAVVGYPPEDLVLRPSLLAEAEDALVALERDPAAGGSPATVVPLPRRREGAG